ncbi:SWI/SNF complex subunit SWI3 [Candida viswanathii]|uniref:SWI/SNF complex subunit SWI3 n=1 Tax=Candida viswanathii TaxID=5486 RepID=A0A367XQF9_9ASCO|nr:SWI/SNF complex subunit SWI3 [Candida viswanathii]
MSASPGEENRSTTTTTTTVVQDEDVANIPSHTILQQQDNDDDSTSDSQADIPPAIESAEELNANQLDEKQIDEIQSLNQDSVSNVGLVSPPEEGADQPEAPVDAEEKQEQQEEEEQEQDTPVVETSEAPQEQSVEAVETQPEPISNPVEESSAEVDAPTGETGVEGTDGPQESSSSPDNGNNLSEAPTEESSEEEGEAATAEPAANANTNDGATAEEQNDDDDDEMKLDIPDIPESSEPQEDQPQTEQEQQGDDEDKMDIDVPQETAIAFQPSASENRQFEEEESKQELGEDEELKNIQHDDPSFDGEFNVDDYDKVNDDLEASVLMNDEDLDLDSKQEAPQVSKPQPEPAPAPVPTEAPVATTEPTGPPPTAPTADNSVVPAQAPVSAPVPAPVPPVATPVQIKEEKPDGSIPNLQEIFPRVLDPEPVTATSSSTVDTPILDAARAVPALEESKDTTNGVAEEEEEEEEDEDEPEEAPRPKPVYKQTHLIVIPSYSSWFNMKKIHKIEKESLPEFFDTTHPSKSPKLYVNYRNFMINSYRLNPNEFLTLTSCRRNLVGDVGTLMRVHRFLNKWGLINYQVKPQFKPGYALEKMPNGQPVDLPYTGEYHVKLDTPRGLFPFDTSRIPVERLDVKRLKSLIAGDGNPTVDQNGNNTEHTNNNNNKKHGLLDESAQQRGQPPAKKRNDGWTTEEYNSLVNAVKTFKNDWYKIANAVGSNKTPQQCILKFLQLPLEDKFNPIKDGDTGSINLLKYAPNYPVSSLDNPVLSNLAFMTKLVDRNVAKAASEAARKAMDECIENKVDQVYNANKDSKPEAANGSADREATAEDAIATTFGIIGGRSHLFSSFEEREMHKISSSIVNHEISKIETKLSKVEELEKIYERERQHLAKQQEELFIDRIALTKSTVGVIKKLEEAITLVEGGNKDAVANLINDAKSLLYKPTRQALEEIGTAKGDSGTTLKADPDSTSQDDNMKPMSLKALQSFKIWAP